ncbi:DNA replication/repair protein RecF [Pacificibacter marinus]|uniref:DNA replication and repair protein RecF n=1 Tax=Pacificibacter marinus TaxID=658057 RepID=A0A1Y5SXT5_9RHOB|nr:DNA replication/repair protein RecF [Pacificibacter marinus]SEL06077.1 DNA replication and repair protein RecF [Pacificibacter marinus]SLN51188.1 DNA replication and repair protein RecF [Pacificibacter marinus]
MSLFIEDLTLSHFRSHRAARLELDGRPIAIWGSNGAGKTNILEAVSLLSPGRGMRRAAMEDIARKPEKLGWKVSAELQSLHQTHDIETWSENGGPRTVKIDGKTAAQVALGRVARVVWLIPAMDRLWIEAPEGRRRFLDRMVMSFEPRHADAVLSYEKAMRERNRLLKDMVRDAHWYAALETQMAASGVAIMQNRLTVLQRIKEAQDGAQTAFPVASLSLRASDQFALPETEGALLSAFKDNRPRDLSAGRTLIGPHRADLGAIYAAKGVPADQCSTGEQKALLISLILANGRALAQDFGAAPIFLLDEVAAHLDGGRRAALYDEICALGAQAFMTGTGPELFAELGTRAAAFEVAEDAGISTVKQHV